MYFCLYVSLLCTQNLKKTGRPMLTKVTNQYFSTDEDQAYRTQTKQSATHMC